MSDATTPPPANDSGSAASSPLPLFYQDPQPVDPNLMPDAGLRRASKLWFAGNAHAVPITVSEFIHVQKHCPIIFAPGEPPLPIAVLGTVQNENFFITSDGSWQEDTYVPAYVRRYPFLLAEATGQDRLFLCVDVKADVIMMEDPEVPFFKGTEPTEVITQALEFCKSFQEDLAMTRAFCEELQKNGLLKETEMRYTQADGSQVIAGQVISVDMEAFDKLNDQAFLDFRSRGLLPLIYCQQASLSNWGRLSARHNRLLAQGAVRN